MGIASERPETAAPARSERVAGYLLPSLGEVIFVLLLVLIPTASATRLLSSDGDAARHITVGRYILESGSIPSVDVFSHTMSGAGFVPYEWLSEVAFALLHYVADLRGVALLSALIVAATFWVMFRFLVGQGGNPVVALALTTLAALASMIHWLARPHLLTTFFTLVVFVLLERHWRRGGRLVYLIPVIFVVWVNWHGGFLVGFILLVLFLGFAALGVAAGKDHFRQRAGPFLAVLLLSSLATLANPAGAAIWPHVLSYFGRKYLVDRTLEYMSPDFHGPLVMIFLGLLLLTLLVLSISRARRQPRHLAIVLIWTAFSLYSARNIPLFAVLVTPILALHVNEILSRLGELRLPGRILDRLRGRLWTSLDNVARIEAASSGWLVAVAAVVVMSVLALNGGYLGESRVWVARFHPTAFPEGATEFVRRNHLPGHMYNDLGWGGYVLYRLFPDYKVFIDGQTDFYGEELAIEYDRLANARTGWREVLDKYGVNWIMVQSGGKADVLLREVEDWRLVYRDGTAVIYVRNVPQNDGIASVCSDTGVSIRKLGQAWE